MKNLLILIYFLVASSPSIVFAEEKSKLSPDTLSSETSKKRCDLYFKKLKVCGQIDWIVPPKKVEMPTAKDRAEFRLQFFRKNKPLEQFSLKQEVHVKLFMPSMGHGSLPTTIEQETSTEGKAVDGVYRVQNVYFSMPGEWEIQVEIKNKNRVIDRASLPYQL